MSNKRIQNQAVIFLAVLVVYSAVYTIYGLGSLLRFSFFEPELMLNNQHTAGHISEMMRWTHFGLWLPANIAGIYACLAGVYASYLSQSGRFFTSQFASTLKHIGTAVLLSGLADIAATSIVPHNLSSLNPAGQLPIRFSFSPEELGLILCGAGFVALGQMMAEATRLSDENKSFV